MTKLQNIFTGILLFIVAIVLFFVGLLSGLDPDASNIRLISTIIVTLATTFGLITYGAIFVKRGVVKEEAGEKNSSQFKGGKGKHIVIAILASYLLSVLQGVIADVLSTHISIYNSLFFPISAVFFYTIFEWSTPMWKKALWSGVFILIFFVLPFFI